MKRSELGEAIEIANQMADKRDEVTRGFRSEWSVQIGSLRVAAKVVSTGAKPACHLRANPALILNTTAPYGDDSWLDEAAVNELLKALSHWLRWLHDEADTPLPTEKVSVA